MTDNYVLVEESARGVVTVTMNRSRKHNAFDQAMIAQLTKVFAALGERSDIRVIVLAAHGKNFSAGADLSWMKQMAAYDRQQNLADARDLACLMETIYRLPQTTIARVQGAAYGGAVGLICCCDLAFATSDAKFCFSEVKLGIVPAVISPYVVEAIGKRAAKRYFQTAEIFDAKRAFNLGLVSDVYVHHNIDSEIDQKIVQLCAAVVANGPKAVRAAKVLVDKVGGAEIDKDLVTFTSELIADIRVSEEGQQGLNAFLNKQSPLWQEEH